MPMSGRLADVTGPLLARPVLRIVREYYHAYGTLSPCTLSSSPSVSEPRSLDGVGLEQLLAWRLGV
jgi:hypothetical protein